MSIIVSNALADYFGAVHYTLYQVSTSTALVEGIYQGAVRIGTLRQHGDLGLGTFADLDSGDGDSGWPRLPIRGDGTVREADDEVLSPFAVITTFAADAHTDLEQCPAYTQLLTAFDHMRDSENIFYALRVDGLFETMHTRAVCKTTEHVTLLQAAAVQPGFRFENVSGTLVGFWTPAYAKTLNIAGYHLHFFSDDRTKGGHVLGCSGSGLHLQLQRAGAIRIALPETEGFLNGDLSRDPSGRSSESRRREIDARL